MLKKAASIVNVGYGMDPKVGQAIQQAADEVGCAVSVVTGTLSPIRPEWCRSSRGS